MDSAQIISQLPYAYPFLFVDDIISINPEGVEGAYTFSRNLPFYNGHFKENPITPGVILTECMAQIGLVSLGIYIMREAGKNINDLQIAMTSTAIDFYKPVYPDERVVVKSKKEYFRFNKLKCQVEMYNNTADLVCRGTIAGMMKIRDAR